MKKTAVLSLLCLLALSPFAQKKYSAIADIQPLYKDKYTFSAKLDEKTNQLSFETNAPVTVVTLETYTVDELAVRKGKEYENTFTKKGQTYSYDLNKPLLKDKYAYWLKVSWGNNGAPLGEYFFRKIIAEVPTGKGKATDEKPPVDTPDEVHYDATNPVISTTIRCDAGKLKVINALKQLEGVFDVQIDINTGILKLNYSADGTHFNDIIKTILANGFDVVDDGQGSGVKKSTKPAANPCKLKSKTAQH